VADDTREKRDRELELAVASAIKALAEHMGTHSFSGTLLGTDIEYVVGFEHVLRDRDRLEAVEALKMNIGPGESFQENVPWVASFTTDEHVYVFAGESLREAIDKAITDATVNADATKPS
jgi:hypothetical protein